MLKLLLISIAAIAGLVVGTGSGILNTPPSVAAIQYLPPPGSKFKWCTSACTYGLLSHSVISLLPKLTPSLPDAQTSTPPINILSLLVGETAIDRSYHAWPVAISVPLSRHPIGFTDKALVDFAVNVLPPSVDRYIPSKPPEFASPANIYTYCESEGAIPISNLSDEDQPPVTCVNDTP